MVCLGNICMDTLHKGDNDDDDDDNDNNNNNNNVTILWNQQVRNDRTIPNNKPDIIIRDNKKRNMNGTISKSLRQYLGNIPGKHEIKELQKKQPYWALHTYYEK